MRSSESGLWALHNPLKSWILYNLSENDLRLLIASLSETEVRLTKICKKNDSKWMALDKQTHADFFSLTGRIDNFKDHTGYPETMVGADATTNTGYFIIKPSRVQHPRLHERHDISVACVLMGSNGQEFHTESVDLSEGGLHFKDSIPPWIAGYFLVTVKSNYQLMCSLVEDQKEKRRVQIVSEESDFHFIQYKNWLSTF